MFRSNFVHGADARFQVSVQKRRVRSCIILEHCLGLTSAPPWKVQAKQLRILCFVHANRNSYKWLRRGALTRASDLTLACEFHGVEIVTASV